MPNSVQKLSQEAEIAVLQAQYKNIDEKVDELKEDLKDLRSHLDLQAESTKKLIREYQTTNVSAHKTLEGKVSALEKWKWMLAGAGALGGALGWPLLSKLLGM